MDYLFFVISIVFALHALRSAFFWVAVWQHNNYQFHRMRLYLTKTQEGRKIFASPTILLKWMTILGFGYIVFHVQALFYYQLAVSALFIVEYVRFMKDLSLRKVQQPVYTLKSVVILFVVISLVTLLYSIPLVDSFPWLLLLDRLVFLFVALVIWVSSLPYEFYYDFRIEKARELLQSFRSEKGKNGLVVVGIFSEPQSPLKDYLTYILGSKYKVVTSGRNTTSFYGIADTIIDSLKKNTEVFITEMKAYTRDEISQISSLLKPAIGVVRTNQTVQKSRFEPIPTDASVPLAMVESLPKDGVALISDIYVKHETKASAKRMSFAVRFDEKQKKKGKGAAIEAFNIKRKKTVVTFDVRIKNTLLHLTTPLLTSSSLHDLLPSIYIAKHLGVSERGIKKAIATIPSVSRRMILKETARGLFVVDNTANVSIEEFKDVLSYTLLYKKRRILVLDPHPLQGKNGYVSYGKELSRIFDYVILTNNALYASLLSEIQAGGGACSLLTGSTTEIADFIKKNAKKGDIVVFEGEQSAAVYEKMARKQKRHLETFLPDTQKVQELIESTKKAFSSYVGTAQQRLPRY